MIRVLYHLGLITLFSRSIFFFIKLHDNKNRHVYKSNQQIMKKEIFKRVQKELLLIL
jgi:hypothetical protein